MRGVRGDKSEGWGGSPCKDSVWLGLWSLSGADPPFSPCLAFVLQAGKEKRTVDSSLESELKLWYCIYCLQEANLWGKQKALV